MTESTFLCLLYIYLLYNRNSYKREVLDSFKKHVVKFFKCSEDVHDFCLNFISDCLELPENEYKLCRNFVLFVRENNDLLGYKF